MPRPDLSRVPEFYHNYIKKAPENDLLTALKNNTSEFNALLKDIPSDKHDYSYAEGKWTVKEILQHIIDNERIQAYRALRFARNDKTLLPGYDENLFAANTHLAGTTVESLLEEFAVTRRSNIMMFENFSDEMLQRTGICFNVTIPVLALGFVLAGHQLHHLNIIRERYLPIVAKN